MKSWSLEGMGMKDNLIRFVNSNRSTINQLRYTLKRRGYVWGSGRDLEDFFPPTLEKEKINLIINPKTKRVYCDPERALDSSRRYYYKIEIIDYNPPW